MSPVEKMICASLGTLVLAVIAIQFFDGVGRGLSMRLLENRVTALEAQACQCQEQGAQQGEGR